MKHWRTTLFGVLQAIGWNFLGIALYADLAGLPKNYTYAHMGLWGCLIIAFGALLHGFHSADKRHVDKHLKVIITIFLLSGIGSFAQEVASHDKHDLKVLVIRLPVEKLKTIDADCPDDKHAANIYFFNRIDAATNSVSFVTLSNSIASHQ